MANQLAAVSGRSFQPRPVRPSGAYIRNVFAQRAEEDFRQQQLQQQQKNFDLQKQAAQDAKTAQQWGTGIAAAGLGVQAANLYQQRNALAAQQGTESGSPTPTWQSGPGWGSLGYGTLGGVGGYATAQAVGGKSWQRGLVGGGSGALYAYGASGGDPYATAIGGILGGSSSMIF